MGDLVAHAGYQRVIADIVIRPAATACGQVLVGGLEPVQRLGKARVNCLVRLELFPQRPQAGSLISRKKAKDAVGGGGFVLLQGRRVMAAKDRGIARVDLDKVMDQQHADHPVDRHAFGCMFSQNKGIEGDVPAMLA